jgi:hypothetical protein
VPVGSSKWQRSHSKRLDSTLSRTLLLQGKMSVRLGLGLLPGRSVNRCSDEAPGMGQQEQERNNRAARWFARCIDLN